MGCIRTDREARRHGVEGWVTLKGEVDWQYQRDDAERVVRRLSGVKGVSNLISIKARPTPEEIKKKIEEALLRTAEIDAKQITVEVDGSKVILTLFCLR
jgi:osmotically-inducible protein OsmY